MRGYLGFWRFFGYKKHIVKIGHSTGSVRQPKPRSTKVASGKCIPLRKWASGIVLAEYLIHFFHFFSPSFIFSKDFLGVLIFACFRLFQSL